jgi:hypothetical protein
VRGHRHSFAVSLAIIVTVSVEQQFRKGAVSARHRMQAGADTSPHPIAFPERLAVATPVDRAKYLAELECEPEPEPQPEQFAYAYADT